VSRSEFSEEDESQPLSRRDEVEFNELEVRLKVSYKTLLLVFVLFDVFHRVVGEVADTDFVQGILN